MRKCGRQILSDCLLLITHSVNNWVPVFQESQLTSELIYVETIITLKCFNRPIQLLQRQLAAEFHTTVSG